MKYRILKRKNEFKIEKHFFFNVWISVYEVENENIFDSLSAAQNAIKESIEFSLRHSEKWTVIQIISENVE